MRIALVVLLGTVLAACSFSTANIESATLSTDADGKNPTTSFSPTDTFHCNVQVANAPEGTKIASVWIAVSAAGLENHEIDRTEITVDTTSAPVHFELMKPTPWPPGAYKVEIHLDGELERTLEFKVVAAGS